MLYRRLRDLREDHDYTQDHLISLLGMHKTTYTNYEQGKREIPLFVVVELAKIYNVSIDFIAGLSNDPTPLHGTNLYSGRAAESSRALTHKVDLEPPEPDLTANPSAEPFLRRG